MRPAPGDGPPPALPVPAAGRGGGERRPEVLGAAEGSPRQGMAEQVPPYGRRASRSAGRITMRGLIGAHTPMAGRDPPYGIARAAS